MGPGFEDAVTRNEREDGLLRAIAAEFPRLRILYVHGGFIAIPADAELTSAASLAGLLEKLRAGRDGTPLG